MVQHFKLCTLAIALLAGLVQVHGGCFCGLSSGKDVCHNAPDCSPLVVRPQSLPKIDLITFNKPKIYKSIPSLTPLRPMGDLCSCRRTIVTPALIPRPACIACGSHGRTDTQRQVESGYSSSQSSTSYHGSSQHKASQHKASQHKASQHEASQHEAAHHESSHHQQDSSAHQHHIGSYYEHHYDDYSPHHLTPADPVSLSLAYSMQNKGCNAHEDKLNFGFRRMPKEIKIVKKINNIPEENLHNLNGEIVELKKIQCSGKSVDEEAAEDLIDEELLAEEESVDEAPVRKLSYGEIGFGPATIKSGKFTTVTGHGSVDSHIKRTDEISSCNDGYVGGEVIIKNIPQPQIYVPPPPAPSPCDSVEEVEEGEVEEGEVEEGKAAVPIRYPAFKYSSSSSSSASKHHSSSSSCSSSKTHEYFSKLEK